LSKKDSLAPAFDRAVEILTEPPSQRPDDANRFRILMRAREPAQSFNYDLQSYPYDPARTREIELEKSVDSPGGAGF